MHINVSMPFDRVSYGAEYGSMDAVIEVSTLLERLGFYAANVTDHPVPSTRWLEAGGHNAQDPFVMLSLIGAHTKKLRLATNILVLPYRNPFIVARAVSTLDAFTNGRVVLGMGAGYMKAEYKALGVDFDKRNDIMDEYIKAMKAAWTGENFAFKGEHYEALGNTMQPAPVQKPHPPLLIGGNSRRAIRRAAELGDAWHPFFTSPQLSATSRTATMGDEMDLVEGINYMKAHCDKIGRATPPEVVLSSLSMPGDDGSPQSVVDRIGQYRQLGVTGAACNFQGATRKEWCENAEKFAVDVLAKIDR